MKVLQHGDRLRDAGAEAVFVSFDEPDAVRGRMLAGVDLPWPMLIDRERVAYRSWGLGRASLRQIWLDPGVYRQYAALLRSGERLRRVGVDPRQLGGDFVVDSGGRVAYSRPQQLDDRPPVGALLQRVEELAT